MSTDPISPAASALVTPARKSFGVVELALGLACAVLLVFQGLLIWRVNVNWDEFYYLTHVHSLVRGELTRTFQMAYTHLFTWLPALGDEMRQITTARVVMFWLFVISAVLLVKLATRWASTGAALVGLLCFIAASPVLRHAASFRADSLILPLLLAVAILITRTHGTKRSDILAGVLYGTALAISIKSALFAPMLALMALAAPSQESALLPARLRSLLVRWIVPAAVALAVFAAILVLHTWSLPARPSDAPAAYAEAVARKTLLDVPFFPRWAFLKATLRVDAGTWALIGIGTALAIARRRWQVAACALALLPLVIYRNAFPYFYIVMLAPASVLAAIAIDEIREWAKRRSSRQQTDFAWLTPAIGALLLFQASVHVAVLMQDGQWPQRQTIAAVHQVFPRPVPYIDHSGMIASFRKVNLFMSSWGMENYRASGKGFMRDVLREHRPRMLLANRDEIDPRRPAFRWLREEDRELIERFFVHYWGPIYVAGRFAEVPASGSTRVDLPFPGRFRVIANVPVTIDGVVRENGDVIESSDGYCEVAMAGDPPESGALHIALVTEEAGVPPAEPAEFASVYVGL